MARFKKSAFYVSLAGASLASAVPLKAASICFEPRAPSAILIKPTKPFCAAMKNCSQWEVDMYRNELSTYFETLRDYAVDLDKYYRSAVEYVQCMATTD
jgi:hypothetical protein